MRCYTSSLYSGVFSRTSGEECRVKAIEQFADLSSYTTVESWRDRIFKLCDNLGFDRTLLAILPNRNTPKEARLAFLQSNYSRNWIGKYDKEKLIEIDPNVAHSATKSTPLILSSHRYSSLRQKELFEEASSYGICSGVTLPIHGINGELGMLCFMSGTKPDQRLHEHIVRSVPELSCFRDFIFETSLQFMQQVISREEIIELTPRELECLKWCASGKSSWATAQILHCSEAAVNFHFANIRRKFGTSSRNQAVVKAIRLGLVNPA